jgi:hypothetical protein
MFPTTEALRTQIARDVTQARRFFTLCHRLSEALALADQRSALI